MSFEGSRTGSFGGGTTLLAAAGELDLELDHYCGGQCSCGTCRVEVVEGATSLSRITPTERVVLGHEAEVAGDRLACQARILGPVTVRIPAYFTRGA